MLTEHPYLTNLSSEKRGKFLAVPLIFIYSHLSVINGLDNEARHISLVVNT